VSKLPFKLTNAQRKSAWEIFQDMEKDTPMNRLLQGDVGSGKTMVAAMAAFEAVSGGSQVALLAPTAILATQHYEGLKDLLKQFGIKTALLIGATKEKDTLKKNIINGEIDFVIGTHALLTDDTEFKNLGLVIIDEQHRFGVEQRQKLMLKSPDGLAPHLLMMTATPIPRSLQLTVFGDLDVSILNELPKGRQPIETAILPEISMRDKLYPHMTQTVKAGQQIYWICKAIDDNPKTETTSVKSRAEKLKKLFPDFRIEFLHGRMKPAEKDEIMERFASGKIDILVSTTVVEVGVNVPNATLMVIEDAENYGLAQLHQLRGRVGRGSVKSYCYLITNEDKGPSRRLMELEKSTDGFYLAEVDLKLRGPGEIYGSLQHGALDLRIATLTDTKLIHKAQTDVMDFLKNDGNMLKYEELRAGISKYQQLTTLN
jgi:ATP-dependent DNA helicase RecG